MDAVVSLNDVVEAMDLPNEESTSYLNPKTGAIVTVTDEDRRLVEDQDVDEQELADGARDRRPSGVRPSNPVECVRVQCRISSKSTNGRSWSASRTVSDLRPAARDCWMRFTVRPRSAVFRSPIRRLGIEDDWFRFSAIGVRGDREGLAEGTRHFVSLATPLGGMRADDRIDS